MRIVKGRCMWPGPRSQSPQPTCVRVRTCRTVRRVHSGAINAAAQPAHAAAGWRHQHLKGDPAMRRSITTALVAAGLSLAIPGGTALAAHAAPAVHTGQSTALPVITVKMNGKKITVGGALLSGGVRVVSTVTGEPAGGPTFVRLNPGVTVAQFFKAAQGDPNNVALIASIVFSP